MSLLTPEAREPELWRLLVVATGSISGGGSGSSGSGSGGGSGGGGGGGPHARGGGSRVDWSWMRWREARKGMIH